MDEDEDVVMKGGDLYRHLQEAGYHEFESFATTSFSESEGVENVEDGIIQGLCITVQKKFEVLWNYVTSKRWKQEKIQRVSAKAIQSSEVLTQDDLLILQHFQQEEEEEEEQQATKEGFSLWQVYSGVAGLMMLPAYLLRKGDCSNYSAFLATGTPFIAFILWTLTARLAAWWRTGKVEKMLQETFKVLQKGNQVATKATRLLQELDLVARGFVLAIGPPSSRPSRKWFNENLRQTTHTFLLTTSSFLFHLHQKIGPRSTLPHKSFVQSLFEENLKEELEEETMGTRHLKSLGRLVRLRTSAVAMEILNCLSVFQHQDYTSNLLKSLSSKVQDIEEASQNIEKNLSFAKTLWLREEEEKEEEKKRSASLVQERKNDVYIALHSLSLHMQAALWKMQQLEAKFEPSTFSANHCDDNNENYIQIKENSKSENHSDNLSSEFDSEVYNETQEQLNQIKGELEAASSCWEEAVSRVNRKFAQCSVVQSAPPFDSSQPYVDETVQECDSHPQKQSIPLFDIGDPVIHDEVFEIYVDKEYSKTTSDDHDQDFWEDHRKQRALMKNEKKQSKRVLKELETILVGRREMWEEREEKALKRQKEEVATNQNPKLEGDLTCQSTQKNSAQPIVTSIASTDNMGKSADGTESHSEVQVPLISTTQSEETEVSGNEEKLELYRKVKEELDHEESKRQTSASTLLSGTSKLTSQGRESREPFNVDIGAVVESNGAPKLLLQGENGNREREQIDVLNCNDYDRSKISALSKVKDVIAFRNDDVSEISSTHDDEQLNCLDNATSLIIRNGNKSDVTVGDFDNFNCRNSVSFTPPKEITGDNDRGNEVDSEEEQLANYYKIRKKLDMEENGNQENCEKKKTKIPLDWSTNNEGSECNVSEKAFDIEGNIVNTQSFPILAVNTSQKDDNKSLDVLSSTTSKEEMVDVSNDNNHDIVNSLNFFSNKSNVDSPVLGCEIPQSDLEKHKAIFSKVDDASQSKHNEKETLVAESGFETPMHNLSCKSTVSSPYSKGEPNLESCGDEPRRCDTSANNHSGTCTKENCNSSSIIAIKNRNMSNVMDDNCISRGNRITKCKNDVIHFAESANSSKNDVKELGGSSTVDEKESHKEVKKKDMIFSNEVESDEEEDGHKIDWSSIVSLPSSRHGKTLEDRMNFLASSLDTEVHGGGMTTMMGFTADLAAEAVALSGKIQSIGEQVTFGGLGEGEETFGNSDTDSEDN
ncbi:uncharacterized protein LOC143018231 [Oratosquilla oratoria]|uniref:uncharacterized protein LOC143018231 n=1 Tax=Oratosquilla oratoria TaxID=337810 RepID=UPI003F773939